VDGAVHEAVALEALQRAHRPKRLTMSSVSVSAMRSRAWRVGRFAAQTLQGIPVVLRIGAVTQKCLLAGASGSRYRNRTARAAWLQ
jgi:hypothetical protein